MIPLSIRPLFWILALLIGYLYGQNLFGMALWVFIVFISVLIHEYGHALTALFFGQKPKIELTAFGGLTSYEGRDLSFGKQFLIVLNGPLFGFSLSLAGYLLFLFSPLFKPFFFSLFAANLFWSVVNLLPLLPLDGGQLLRIGLEAFFGLKGFRIALAFSMGFSLVAALASFLFGAILAGAFFSLFAFENYTLFRESRFATQADRSDTLKKLLFEAEECLKRGYEEGATERLEKIRAATKGKRHGMIGSYALDQLAWIALRKGDRDEAYRLLLEIDGEKRPETTLLLHELAFERENFPLVASLAEAAYQIAPESKVALRSAKAFAHLKKGKEAGGYLMAALEGGEINREEILQEKPFSSLADDPDFSSFF